MWDKPDISSVNLCVVVLGVSDDIAEAVMCAEAFFILFFSAVNQHPLDAVLQLLSSQNALCMQPSLISCDETRSLTNHSMNTF